MQIEPAADDFAERYRRGEAQVVWTTLVADLETPVVRLPQARRRQADELPARVGRRRRGARALLDHRARSRPDLARERRRARRSTATHATDPDAFVACEEAPLEALRALIAESRIALPDALPPMAAGIFGYLGYDMVRLMEELPCGQPGPDRHSRCRAGPAARGGRVRRGRGHHHGGHAGAARPGRAGRHRVQLRGRAPDRRRRQPRHADPELGRRRSRAAHGPADLEHLAGRVRRDGAARQGLHRGGRRLPGRAVAALRGAVRASAVRALSRAAPGQPGAVPLFPRFRRLRGRRARARRSWCACATAWSRSGRSPARGRAGRRRTRTRRSRRSCSPIPRSAPST